MSKKPTNSQTVLANLTNKLRSCLAVDAMNVYAIGKILVDAHKVLEHGEWLPWVEDFGISEQSARNYKAAHRFKVTIQSWDIFKSTKFGDLKLRNTVIYELSEWLSNLPNHVATTHGTLLGSYEVNLADIEAVLVAAKDAWIGTKRLEAILRERHPLPAVEDTSSVLPVEETGEEVHEEDDTEPNSERMPRVPKSEAEPPKQAVDMLSFASWVEGIWRMRDDTAPHTLRNAPIKREQIEGAIAFLQAVAELLPKRGSTETELSPQQVRERMEALEQAPA
jgi:hypothetical protein